MNPGVKGLNSSSPFTGAGGTGRGLGWGAGREAASSAEFQRHFSFLRSIEIHIQCK